MAPENENVDNPEMKATPEENFTNTIDSRDLMDLLGPEGASPEPEISFEEERREQPRTRTRTEAPASTSASASETSDADLRARYEAAIRANEAMERMLAARMQAPQPQRPEPTIEYEEPLPGFHVAKDPEYRPVRIPAQLLEKVNIDPSIAPGLEVLANVFYQFINTTVPQRALSEFETRQQRQGAMQERYTSFQRVFSDLADHMDLVETVESQARNRERVHEQLRGNDYINEIARRTRAKIASFRGQTLEEYESELKSQRPRSIQSAPTTLRSNRAVSTGGGATRRAAAPRNANDQLFNDSIAPYFGS